MVPEDVHAACFGRRQARPGGIRGRTPGRRGVDQRPSPGSARERRDGLRLRPDTLYKLRGRERPEGAHRQRLDLPRTCHGHALPMEQLELQRQLRRPAQERLAARCGRHLPDAAPLFGPRHDGHLHLRHGLRHRGPQGDGACRIAGHQRLGQSPARGLAGGGTGQRRQAGEQIQGPFAADCSG